MVWRGLREGGVPAPVPSHEGSGSVIVADDDQDVRTMLRTLLELDGHEVIEAKDGDAAWKLCADCLRAVFVAEIQLPGLDGWNRCRWIRQCKYSPELKRTAHTSASAT